MVWIGGGNVGYLSIWASRTGYSGTAYRLDAQILVTDGEYCRNGGIAWVYSGFSPVGAQPVPVATALAAEAKMPEATTTRILRRRYPVSVAHGGEVKVTLTPRVGKATLCAAILDPAPTGGES